MILAEYEGMRFNAITFSSDTVTFAIYTSDPAWSHCPKCPSKHEFLINDVERLRYIDLAKELGFVSNNIHTDHGWLFYCTPELNAIQGVQSMVILE